MAKHKSKRSFYQQSLCESLGEEYSIRNIDFENCIYRDFGNGFNVEISGTYTLNVKNPATIYLWLGEEYMVKSVKHVAHPDIKTVVDELCEYSKALVRDGYTTRDAIFYMKYTK